MGLIETLRKSDEQSNNVLQHLLDETNEERRASILRKKMRVYAMGSRAKRAATARTSDAALATDNQRRSEAEEQTVAHVE